jgi:ethanolamine utilization cobalamin adenosyltransferase
MKVITEGYLRKTYRVSLPQRLELGAGQVLTPAAVDLLREQKVEIVHNPQTSERGRPSTTKRQQLNRVKPEHLTHLVGQQLVSKGHPRIALRGKLDSLQAELLLLQWTARHQGRTDLTETLAELLDWGRRILKAEVTGTPLNEKELWGWTAVELREMSQQPDRHFGLGHFLPDVSMGVWLLRLNRLRCQVREVELAAIRTFCNEPSEPNREDLLQALNRMSSAVYILMLKERQQDGDG